MDELINLAKRGDKEAFTKLVLENKRELYGIAKAKLHSESDIEDAMQECVIKAYTKMKSLKDNSKFKYWIFKILINECNRIYRQKKFQEVSIESLENSASGSENSHVKEFDEIMELLNDSEKLLVMLFYGSGYSTKEISKIINTNENTIKTKLRRIREKLKIRLDERKEG